MVSMRIQTGTIKALLSVDGAGTAVMSFVRLPKVGDEVVFRHEGKSAHVRVTGLRREMAGATAGTFIVTAKAA